MGFCSFRCVDKVKKTEIDLGMGEKQLQLIFVVSVEV